MTSGPRGSGRSSLTEKQRAFFAAWLANGRNGAAAYRTAYNTTASPQRCHEMASDLLKHPKIASLVAEAESRADEATRRVLDRYEVTRERIIAALARRGFSNMFDYVRVLPNGDAVPDLSAVTEDQWAAISEITVDEYAEGRGKGARQVKRVKVKLSDARAALMDLARITGEIVERQELTGKDGGPISVESVSETELARRVAYILTKGAREADGTEGG
jgi:phage terminase small subunit